MLKRDFKNQEFILWMDKLFSRIFMDIGKQTILRIQIWKTLTWESHKVNFWELLVKLDQVNQAYLELSLKKFLFIQVISPKMEVSHMWNKSLSSSQLLWKKTFFSVCNSISKDTIKQLKCLVWLLICKFWKMAIKQWWEKEV